MNQHVLRTAAGVVKRRGCSLHYWLIGRDDRPLVVLIHGMALDHRAFARQVAALAGEYQVLVWDLRGHGRSQPAGDTFSIPILVDDLLAILFHVGRQRAFVVGHSLGGVVAQELAFRFPARVQGLAVFGCSCITLPQRRFTQSIREAAMPLLSLFGVVPYWPLLRLNAVLMSVRREVRLACAEMAGFVRHETFAAALAALSTSRHPEPRYRIRQPLLVAYGEEDMIGRPAQAARAWAARDQHATVVPIPNAGHAANLDNPPFFNRMLLDFLATHAR